MTQAINLANLANNVDTLGNIPPSVLNAAVPISKGGTGETTAALARTALDVPQAVYAVPTGGIIMWSGSIATIPTGWLLCNGTSGTPDLRNRFIIGAYLDNAGISNTTITGANTKTGGSKDAIIVSHTHTATVTDPGHSHTYRRFDPSTQNASLSTPYGGRVFGYTDNIATSTSATGITVGNSTTGSAGTDANLVPYYAIAFIMKS